ncbi:MAG: hypothetical protein R3E96_10780 [Planctomycetota bacterium]
MPAGLDALQLAWPSFPIDPVLAGPGSSPRTKVKAVLLTGAEERVVELTEDAPEYRWRLPQQSGSDHLLPLPAAPVAGSGILRTRAMIALGAITALFVFIARRLPKRGALAGLALLPLAWFGVLRMPRATVVPPETQLEVFGVLHANLYRAFDFHEAEAVYDALEASTQGELLRRLYGEIHDSLVLEEEDGLLCRVEAVTPFDTVLEAPSADSPPGTFGVLAHWRVDGVLHHWGHSHHRRQELRAHFDVAPLAEGWRLVGSRILESKRVPVAEPAPANPTPAAGNLPEDEVW